MADRYTEASPAVAWRYTATALWMLVALAVSATVFDLLARNEWLTEAMAAPRREYQRHRRGYYEHRQHFTDWEDRLILDELPQADYSHGGVVFLGSSNMKTALTIWKLPPEQRRLIHNYGIGAANHTFIDQLVRYLVEERELLAAGGEKTLVAFGLSYHVTAHAVAEGFFSNLWRRHGLYDYSLSEGIVPRRMSPFARSLRVERARVAGFLRAVPAYFRLLQKHGRSMAPESIQPRIHDASSHVERWKGYMGADWREKVRSQLAELSRTIAYLQGRGAKVAVVLLPLGTWEEELPFSEPYHRQLRRLCRSRLVPVHDMRNLLEDDDLADSVHPTLQGAEKLHRHLMRIALPHLQEIGALRQ